MSYDGKLCANTFVDGLHAVGAALAPDEAVLLATELLLQSTVDDVIMCDAALWTTRMSTRCVNHTL